MKINDYNLLINHLSYTLEQIKSTEWQIIESSTLSAVVDMGVSDGSAIKVHVNQNRRLSDKKADIASDQSQ